MNFNISDQSPLWLLAFCGIAYAFYALKASAPRRKEERIPVKVEKRRRRK